MRAIRVIVADDHTILRQGLRRLLQDHEDIDVIGGAQDGNEALQQADRLRPDVVVMDISMENLNGIEATFRLKKQFPHMKVVILSIHRNVEYVQRAVQAGAEAYVVKEAAVDELVEVIRTVRAGDRYFSRLIPHSDILAQLSQQPLRRSVGHARGLTPREREILQLIAEGNTNRAIARQLTISPKTVDTHRMHIMRKLDVHDVASLVRYAVREGLVEA